MKEELSYLMFRFAGYEGEDSSADEVDVNSGKLYYLKFLKLL